MKRIEGHHWNQVRPNSEVYHVELVNEDSGATAPAHVHSDSSWWAAYCYVWDATGTEPHDNVVRIVHETTGKCWLACVGSETHALVPTVD